MSIYTDYLKDMNKVLVTGGVVLPINLDGGDEAICHAVSVMEQYFYFNRVLTIVNSPSKIETLFSTDKLLYYDLVKEKFLAEYSEELKNMEMELYTEYPMESEEESVPVSTLNDLSNFNRYLNNQKEKYNYRTEVISSSISNSDNFCTDFSSMSESGVSEQDDIDGSDCMDLMDLKSDLDCSKKLIKGSINSSISEVTYHDYSTDDTSYVEGNSNLGVLESTSASEGVLPDDFMDGMDLDSVYEDVDESGDIDESEDMYEDVDEEDMYEDADESGGVDESEDMYEDIDEEDMYEDIDEEDMYEDVDDDTGDSEAMYGDADDSEDIYGDIDEEDMYEDADDSEDIDESEDMYGDIDEEDMYEDADDSEDIDGLDMYDDVDELDMYEDVDELDVSDTLEEVTEEEFSGDGDFATFSDSVESSGSSEDIDIRASEFLTGVTESIISRLVKKD